MEVVRTVGSVMGSMKMVIDLIAASRELDNKVAGDLKSLKDDFCIIHPRELQQLPPIVQSRLQDLAYEIDDFIQDLWVPGPFGSLILSAFALDPRSQDIQCINDLKESWKNLKVQLTTKSSDGQSSSVGSPIPYAPDLEDLVGIEGPKNEILELLLSPRPVEPHLRRLSVISIVGCSGSGKTALAKVLYEDDNVTKNFDFKSWVVASEPSSVDNIVDEIRLQKDKRYLIFVDDVVRETPLKEIKKALGENDMDSRIIVITRVPSIVRDYSSGSFEYTMQGLDQENSRKLFRVKFIRPDPYTEEVKLRLGDKDVDKIIDKCDGLPIALISAAERLRGKGQRPGSEDYKHVSQELGRYLACSDSDFEDFRKQNRTEVAFAEMRRARVEPYENLLNHSEKLCLLYVSMFPCGHQIISKNLVRRLIAEGLVTGDSFYAGGNSDSVVGDARECVRKLMEHHMIEPVPARNYSNVAKRCRVHSIMLQFTIKKAVSRNFLGMIHEDDQPLRSPDQFPLRRLTIQAGFPVQDELLPSPEEKDLSVLRSLAIFKSRIILDLGKCKRVRVLHLEGCRDLTRTDLDNICLLLFLKYLRLRNTVIPAELPGNMKNLKFLETLDTRGTQLVIKLPIQVLTLPRLAYLFGKFELTNLKQQKNVVELTKFFSNKESALHTLGGIAVHEEKGLEIVLLAVQHATKLKKVKVWFMNTPQVGETSQLCLSRRAMQRNNPPATCTPPGFPSAGAGPSVYSIGNAHDPTPATSSTAEPIPGATGPAAGLSTRKWYTLLKPKWKRILHRLFTGCNRCCTSDAAQDPAPTTCTRVTSGAPGLPSAGAGPSEGSSGGNTPEPAPATSTPLASDAAQDPAPTTCTRVTGGAPGLPSAGAGPSEGSSGGNTPEPAPATSTPLASDAAQDPAPTTCTRVTGGAPGLLSAGAGPSEGSSGGNTPEPAPATSTPLASDAAQDPAPTTCTRVTGGAPGLLSAGAGPSEGSSGGNTPEPAPATSTPLASDVAQDPAPTTCTRVTGGAPGLPSAGAGPSEGSSGGNTPEPAPATSTPLASDTRELIHCASRLTNTLLEHHGKLESVFIDFNGVPNTFPDFRHINGTISSIKLRRAQIILPGCEMLGIVGNLKKLYLFSTGLESKQLASLQYFTCLQYLHLEEEGDGLWNSDFHVQARGFISLISLCFESSNSSPPPLKIDEGVTTPLASLLLLCKETCPQVEGICHLAKLNEVILHPSATDYVVTAWKEQAKKNINIPHVEKKKPV